MDDWTLDALVRAAADQARASLGPHPSPEELVAYHVGELATEASEALQDHLALCRDCTAVVLAAAEFMEPDETPAATTELPAAAAGSGVPVRSAGVPRIWAYSGWATAAAILVVAGVLARFNARFGARPEANVPVKVLMPLETEHERGEATPETVADRASSIVLVLGVPESFQPPGRAEFIVEGATGTPTLTIDGVVPAADGSVTLFVPKKQLPAGTYVVRLFGAEPSKEAVAAYALRLSGP